MPHFVFVINKEAVGELPIPNLGHQSDAVDKLIAIASSNPKIVVSEEPVPEGYIWDGKKFTPPA